MPPGWPVVFSAILLFVGGILGAILTYILTGRKEHAADWRKLKLEQYREFILALSGIVEGRSTDTAQLRYADAANAMMLVAPAIVYQALQGFLTHNSPTNLPSWRRDEHDRLLNVLVHAMRVDTDPSGDKDGTALTFWLMSSGQGTPNKRPAQ